MSTQEWNGCWAVVILTLGVKAELGCAFLDQRFPCPGLSGDKRGNLEGAAVVWKFWGASERN